MSRKPAFLNVVIIIGLLLTSISSIAQAAFTCPCSIWGPDDTPATPAQPEAKPVELGVVFKTDLNVTGYITGVRFYKGTGNSGTHYGHLWTTGGTLLGTATFTNETETGWQDATFPTPIAILANTPYIASYHTTTGHWSLTSGGLTNQVYKEPLTALATLDSTLGNGVYKYGPSGSFPNETVQGSNYWVDVVFNTSIPADNTDPTIGAVTPLNGAINVDLYSNVTALFSEEMTPATISATNFELRGPGSTLIPATVSYTSGSYTATLNPDSGLTGSTVYTATIKGGATGVTDLAGRPLSVDYSWTFTTAAPDLTPPTISTVTPESGALGVSYNANVTVRFSEAMDAATINTSNFELRDPDSTLIASTVSYAPGSFSATLDPTSALTGSTVYTATIKSGVTDLAAHPLGEDHSWSFTTAMSPDQGPGGPILIVADANKPFGRYYAEILRNEGMNEFAAADISTITPTQLNNYDVVILGEMARALTTDEVTLFTNWVTAGGNLIAMRPDKQLAGLLGLTDASGVLPAPGTLNAYLQVDTTQAPGLGIVGETIQYHGLADLYTLNLGTTAVATLYSTSTLPTLDNNPAVTIRNVGTNGGQAAAFTFDLARSVVYTRQGNPAWAGQNRDPNDPSVSRIITHDMYYGNMEGDIQPDYVDKTKLTIPQADEQQRLLANLIQFMNLDKKPLPHFWYFPRGEKAVVIMTGDDHGGGTGTIGRFDIYKLMNPGCSVENWECIRASSYMFISGAMSDAQAASYNADGFEIGLHVNTGCVDWTPASLVDFYQNQLVSWYAAFPSLPPQISERTHCVNWTDWVTQAKVQASHGIRMDTNYYYYPPAWVDEKPGMYTGSGMPMRFADLDGTMIDVYQGVTQMTDESSYQGYGTFNPLQINTLLDNAVGTPGFYGAFLANMHTDSAVHPGSVTIINAALDRGVPVISGKQMVTWLDGRNASSFDNITWNAGTLNFTIALGTGSNGIQAMLPTSSNAGFFTGITRNGTAVSFTKETIKGVEYAFFNAGAGNYAASYAPDETPPEISNVLAIPASDGTARITWTTDELSTSEVNYGLTTDLGSIAGAPALVTSHTINLTNLTLGQTYYYRVTSVDSSSNSATYPPTGDPLSFKIPSACLLDTTAGDFGAGSLVPNTFITTVDGGEVTLAPAFGAEFFGSTLPSNWFVAQYPSTGTGGTATVNGGVLTVDGARTGPDATFGPGRSLDFVATFTAGLYQHVGFGQDFSLTPWAIFSTDSTNGTTLQARTRDATSPTAVTIDTTITGNWIGTPHHYRIEWNASSVVYYIDGSQVASHPLTIATPMRPMAAEYTVGGTQLTVDWLRMSPYQTPGTFTSRVFDTFGPADWGAPQWIADVPADTSLSLSVSTGNTPVPDSSWSAFAPMTYGAPIGGTSRYLQYRAEFATTVNSKTPVLQQVGICYEHHPDLTAPIITGRSPSPDATGVPVDSNIVVTFSEAMNPATINTDTIHLRVYGTTTDLPASVSYSGLNAILNPTASLTIGARYTVLVTGGTSGVADVSTNHLAADATWNFTAYFAGSFTDNTSADFNAGAPGTGTYVSETTDGEVILKPTVGNEFFGTTLPTDWSATGYGGTPSAVVSGGTLTLNAARLYTADGLLYGPGRWLEFEATFNNGNFQHIGFGTDYSDSPWAIFTTESTGTIFSVSSNPGGSTLTAGNFGTSRRYRIEWNSGSISYYYYSGENSVLIGTHTGTAGGNMRPMPAAYGGPSPKPLVVNWLRMGPYATTGTFESRIFDAGQKVDWQELTYNATVPVGTLSFRTRTGDTSIPDSSWSSWADVNSPIPSPDGRYLQYQASFTSTDANQTPILYNVTLTYGAVPTGVDLNYFRAARTPGGVQLSWETVSEATLAGFNLYRHGMNGDIVKINADLIPPERGGRPEGFAYLYLDESALLDQRYEYRLEVIETNLEPSASMLAPYWPFSIQLPMIRH